MELKFTPEQKQEIVLKYLSGNYTFIELNKEYGIKGNSTIRKWVDRYLKKVEFEKRALSKSDDLDFYKEKAIRLEEENLRINIELSESKKRESLSQDKILGLETLIQVVDEKYKTDVKKSCGPRQC